MGDQMFRKFLRKLPWIAALLCALFTAFSFAACKPSGYGDHVHVGGTATCTERAKCEICDAEYGVLAAHTFGAWVEETPANCSVQGTKGHKDCTVCRKHFASDGTSEIADLTIAANGDHDFKSEWSKDTLGHWHECKRDAAHKNDYAAHAWGAGVITKPATETENGIKTFTCTVCRQTKTEIIPNEEHKHSYGVDWESNEAEHWRACLCGAKADRAAHDFVGGICKTCKRADPDYRPSDQKYTFPENVNFGYDVGVHDPSIFRDPKDGTFYAFGSHFAVASSTDLIHWTQRVGDGSAEESGQREAQKLYGSGVNWRTVLAKAVAHAGSSAPSTWAPDVEYHNGKYYMYVSLSSFGSNRSAIVRVEADSVLGVYGNEQMIVKSGSGDAPNCIDPELFYDKDGGLWMVYGSFFGGIYIKELYNSGANWGLPKENGFGTLLWKGYSPPDAAQGGPEGPYIFRNGDYYYLMVSDGSLSTNYHMRVARSTNPAGPYVDITGADMAAAHGKGNKLAGNWKFDGETGSAAYGHNSVCEIDGEFFVVAHMRYNDNGNVTGWHNVRVHRLLFNEQGWPVLATERYAGETLGKIDENEIAGKYDLILHDNGVSASFIGSSRYVFAADHTISGAENGTWIFKPDGNYIEITLNGVTYKGVAMPVWTSRGGVLAFSAVSDGGRSLWANGYPASQNPNLDIIAQKAGNANDTNVPAFAADGGFTVSFRSAVTGGNAGDDWNALALMCRGLQISLPNLRVTANNTAGLGTAQADMYPAKNGNHNVGNGAWNSYLATSCFVTISFDGSGIRFYKNGECTQNYVSGAVIEGSLTVGAFLNAFFEGVAAEGFVFARSGLTANDLIVSRGAADAAKAKEIYVYYA